MNIREQFLQAIERFIADSGMDATSFGVRAMNDPNFVFQIRKGRNCSIKTIERVYEFMEAETQEAA